MNADPYSFSVLLNISSSYYLGPSKKEEKNGHSNKIILTKQYGAPQPSFICHLCEECAPNNLVRVCF